MNKTNKWTQIKCSGGKWTSITLPLPERFVWWPEFLWSMSEGTLFGPQRAALRMVGMKPAGTSFQRTRRNRFPFGIYRQGFPVPPVPYVHRSSLHWKKRNKGEIKDLFKTRCSSRMLQIRLLSQQNMRLFLASSSKQAGYFLHNETLPLESSAQKMSNHVRKYLSFMGRGRYFIIRRQWSDGRKWGDWLLSQAHIFSPDIFYTVCKSANYCCSHQTAYGRWQVHNVYILVVAHLTA